MTRRKYAIVQEKKHRRKERDAMKQKYRTGDRVASGVMGFYYEMPGTIVKPAATQTGDYESYIIDLDIGITIVLDSIYIKALPDNKGD